MFDNGLDSTKYTETDRRHSGMPILWDVLCKEYKDRNKKIDTITGLGKKYSVSFAEMENKIQSLKNQFCR